MDPKSLIKKLSDSYKNRHPFTLFSGPKNDLITAYFQKDGENHMLENLEADGLVLAPFNYTGKVFYIPDVHSDIYDIEFPSAGFSEVEISLEETERDHQKHLDLVRAAKQVINNRNANKIVVTRRKEVSISSLDFSTIVNRLFNLYPNSCRYLWYHPETGLWCGASPEVLLKTNGNSFETTSLAGTQLYSPKRDAVWTEKEREEQQIVTDTITSNLQKVTSVMKISKTYDFEAGALVHLRTDIEGVLKKNKTTIASVTNALHPTPAICGTPQKTAKKFILENEGYDREFYTGFIGRINSKARTSQLFVNLRCMKLLDDRAFLYVGGGITSQSIAEDEWHETRNKLQTMLQVLQPLL